MLAAFRNQKLSLTQYAQHTGAKFGAWHGVCGIRQHGICSILTLTSVNWMLFCSFVKLKAASGMVLATC
jgi:hypothetical protein